MKIILLASVDPRIDSKDIYKYHISPAASNFINNLTTGIYKNGINIEILSMQPLLKKFIGYRKKDVFKFKNIKITLIKYFQCGKLIRLIHQITSCFFELLKKVKYENFDCIISYNTNIEWLLPAYLISKIFKINNAVIVADYTPSYNNLERNIKCHIETVLLKKSNKIIALSPNIIDKINYGNKHIVIEGGVEFYNNTLINRNDNKIIIMYSGELSFINGVDIIIEAAAKANDRIEFWISGKGELEEEIKKISKIKYLGFLSKSEYINRVLSADIMVSPRRTIYEENLYNFPSKILEYLSLGKIVVSTKLNTLKSINNYIYYFNENADDLMKKIYILSNNLIFYKNKCMSNANIVYKNFNWSRQAKKIIKFIGSNT